MGQALLVSRRPEIWLQLAVFCLFSARAWQHFFGDLPYRALLWDEYLMSGVVKILGYTWSDYVTDPQVEHLIVLGIRFFGGLLLLGILAVFPLPIPIVLRRIFLYIGSAVLFILVLASCRDQFWQVGQFLELTLQWTTPLFLAQYISTKKEPASPTWTAAKLALAATFIGHGMYAVGFYSVPGFFMTMCMRVFACTEAQAKVFLAIAGLLDFVAALLIFGPKRAAFWSYVYMAVWGGLTALARVAANLYWPFWLNWLIQWWPEMVYRLPHSLVPLFLLLEQKQNKRK